MPPTIKLPRFSENLVIAILWPNLPKTGNFNLKASQIRRPDFEFFHFLKTKIPKIIINDINHQPDFKPSEAAIMILVIKGISAPDSTIISVSLGKTKTSIPEATKTKTINTKIG